MSQSSNQRRNQALINQYLKELKEMLGDVSKIDERVLTKSVNAGLKEVKLLTPVGEYPSEVSFVTENGKQVSFSVKPKIGGTLRKGWSSPPAVRTGGGAEKSLENNVSYASYVNDGHRVVTIDGFTLGYLEGKHMLEKAGNLVNKAMIQEFEKEIEKVNREHDK